MELSVVICTYNRSPELRRTLETMRSLTIPASVRWELLVVDNNSTDDTPAVCGAFQEHLPLRYVFEPRQGVAAARNRGATSARGELIAFADDDVDVLPGWLSALYAAAAMHTEASFFGGKILPLWLTKPPDWFAENAGTALQGVTGYFDLGEKTHLTDVLFFGANMAFRRRLFDGGLRFREDIGRTPNGLIHGEESELFERLTDRNEKGCYVADAVVHHRIPASRMTERYLRSWWIGFGATNVRLGHVHRRARSIWFDLIYNALRYALTRWTCPSRLWLKPAVKMAIAWGVISELRRR